MKCKPFITILEEVDKMNKILRKIDDLLGVPRQEEPKKEDSFVQVWDRNNVLVSMRAEEAQAVPPSIYAEALADLERDARIESRDIKTKQRVINAKRELNKDFNFTKFKIDGYDEMIIQKDIDFQALCEHHLLSFSGKAYIGYIPNKYVCGLSKLARSVEKYLHPYQQTTQEKATIQIAQFLEKNLEPKGLMVVLVAQHSCISCRGIKKPSITITSSCQGVFRKNVETRLEFLQLVGDFDA